jgi:glycosyltransferase involved in cell wall biosynthesis
VNTQPLVTVIMPVFNQAPYVAQAIESVLSQQCDFDYRLIIADDCSLDNTYSYITEYQKKYPDKIFLFVNDVNIGLAANYAKAFEICSSKYIAILEGDDYYSDPLKLQKQFDILEANPDVGLIHTNYFVLYDNGKTRIGHGFENGNRLQGSLFDSLLMGNCICPATVLLRTEIVKRHVDWNYAVSNSLKTIDLFLWLEISLHSKILYIADVTACYRILSSSVSNSNDVNKTEQFVNSSLKILEYYLTIHNLPKDRVLQVKGNAYYGLIYLMLIRGDKRAKKYSAFLYLKSSKQLWLWALVNYRLLQPFVDLQVGVIRLGSIVKQAMLKIISHRNGGN